VDLNRRPRLQFFGGSLDLLRPQPNDIERDRSEIALRFSLAICMGFGVGDFEAMANVLERTRELSEKAGDDVTLFEVLWFLAFPFLRRVQSERQGLSGPTGTTPNCR
jgi:hypothetical protein